MVSDFGIALAVSTGGDRLTETGLSLGTPHYVSPEQATGEQFVGRPTDLYALGCVAYWMLTGTLVFEGTTAMETMMHHARTEPEPPSQRTELPVPEDLESAIMACLEKDPDRRPPNADALAATLSETSAGSTWTHELAERWWETNRPRGSASS